MAAARCALPAALVDHQRPVDAHVFPDSRARPVGDSFTVIDAADHRLLRGPAFYDLFIDRSRWPALIRGGYDRATLALDAFR